MEATEIVEGLSISAFPSFIPPFAPSNRSLIIHPIGCCECFDGYL